MILRFRLINPLHSNEDTQPSKTKGPNRRRHRRPWKPLSVIAITACSLALTTALFLHSLSPKAFTSTINSNQITITLGHSIRRYDTQAQTLGELLSATQLTLPPDAILSHPLDSTLVDGMNITITPPRSVTIITADEQQTIHTTLDNPLHILQAAAVSLDDADRIWVNGAPARLEALADWTVPAQRIEIQRAAHVTIIDDDHETEIVTSASTVAEALSEAGIALQPNDKPNPPADTAINGDMTITIERATTIAIELDGVIIEARTQANRVDEALAALDAPLFGADYSLPSGDTPIVQDMFIQIIRVTEERLSAQETIPFQTQYQADAELLLDQTAITQIGQNGTREIHSIVRYENGVEVSRHISATIETQSPQDQIIRYGTKITPQHIDTPAGPRLYWRVLCMLATSYHPAALGGDSTTSIGWTLTKGVVAADPALIRYRTEVFVPGYGVATMADTGGPRSSRYWIDLGYSDDDFQSWRKYVKVYLLTPVPPEIDYTLPTWTPIRSVPGNCGP